MAFLAKRFVNKPFNPLIVMTKTSPTLAILASFSGQGGVERMLLNLLEHSPKTPLLLFTLRRDHPELAQLPEHIEQIALPKHYAFAVNALAKYLQQRQPDVLLAAKERGGILAIKARQQAQVKTKIFIRLGTHLSAALRFPWQKFWRYGQIRRYFPQADGIFAVSQGVADDFIAICPPLAPRLQVLPNPTVRPEILTLAQAPCPHPWLDNYAVIIGVGRLTRQKDFSTLIQAFARLAAKNPQLRLMILGEGQERRRLLTMAAALGVGERLALVGYVKNPYAYVARAKLFVLSSRWEGSPNVLIEALSLGIPVVATACPSGPREILQDGRFGALVAVGAVAALAAAMEETLENPLDSNILRAAVAPFQVENSRRAYWAAMGLAADDKAVADNTCQ
jgi:glycosyltransferase involved in cell wall biosynthesis